jgi:hypothetical protein
MSQNLRCAIADIVFFTNYSDPKAPVIHLGKIAEGFFKGDNHRKRRVLSLIGRSEISKDELDLVSGFNRQELENIWAVLSNYQQAAWAERTKRPDVGALLEYLAEQHSYSLHFEPPQAFSLRKAAVAAIFGNPKSFGTVVMGELEARLVAERPNAQVIRKEKQKQPSAKLPKKKAATVNQPFRPYNEAEVLEALAA